MESAPETDTNRGPTSSTDRSGPRPPRVVTAAALFDGHDAAINLIRRLLVAQGAEVVHLGHHRSAAEIARAAIEEDADAVAVSSYQGGHNEFFPYLRELLDRSGGESIRIFGGGGGVILPREVEELERSCVVKIFTPEDGRELGLEGMISRLLELVRARPRIEAVPGEAIRRDDPAAVARAISFLESGGDVAAIPVEKGEAKTTKVLGVTGTGGAGKSSLVDEIVLRLVQADSDSSTAILAVDPTKKRTGGALLGDRLRMNSIYAPNVFLRSLSTGGSALEIAPVVGRAVELLRRLGFDLVIVETAGIGQGSSAVLEVADVSLYVMTSDFGGPTQLEKIDMLDFADVVAVNKSDRRGSEDATREVRRHVARSRAGDDILVTATCASRFCDAGVDELFEGLVSRLALPCTLRNAVRSSAIEDRVTPIGREQHLSEAARAVRSYHERGDARIESFRRWHALDLVARQVEDSELASRLRLEADRAREDARGALESLEEWEKTREVYGSEELRFPVRGEERGAPLWRRSVAGSRIPRVSLPPSDDPVGVLRFLTRENLPGHFPFTAGVFPLKRDEELATRQFAGEGPPERTNQRFHYLTRDLAAKRLSVAFDSVTLYGADPGERPDIFGKIGESGVNVATLDDMRRLFDGFDLCAPTTSVSMTINGPAPVVLAMFFNAAIDASLERFRVEMGREPDEEEATSIRAQTLRSVRGTVQADILKEDQAQNTCIFSTAFALRLMGDVQEFFVENEVRNFYSVSVSGYHIAEAGANPITQLAFTLANALTYVEYYRDRGMSVDSFAPSFSFFFSNGLDPEYAVLGRVARRIWAIVMRDVYGANERSQKLKYHIQTSGRSLHAREMSFNDIRTTLQALMAILDHCNSLHTNAYDEAVTTPTAQSVRRALAIQLIIQKELGLAKSENSLQGSYFVDELTDLVEEAVLAEFERISERGGVLGAMETGYLRSKIQEESLHYESLKHSGELEIVGVNTFLGDEDTEGAIDELTAVRASAAEKSGQIERLRGFQGKHQNESSAALERLQGAVRRGDNVFSELMSTVRVASLGEITQALYAVGGQYRRAI